LPTDTFAVMNLLIARPTISVPTLQPARPAVCDKDLEDPRASDLPHDRDPFHDTLARRNKN